MLSVATSHPAKPEHCERRWPVALTILAVEALLIVLPDRVRILPAPIVITIGALILGVLAAAALHPQGEKWLRIERITTFAFVAIAGAGNLAVLRLLILDMMSPTQAMDGLALLSSSIAVWAVNVMMFSLLYWQLDRGGPGLRASGRVRPDWIFPQDQAAPEHLPPEWRPQFIDYLFLGYSTATAFSTTDAVPLTGRAKFVMMAESTISLVTLVVVGARAINLLGG